MTMTTEEMALNHYLASPEGIDYVEGVNDYINTGCFNENKKQSSHYGTGFADSYANSQRPSAMDTVYKRFHYGEG
jgi:hypothetical protein